MPVVNVIAPSSIVNCPGCPQQVVEAVASRVQETLDQVRRVKYLTTAFARFFGELADNIQEDLSFLVDIIPTPPVLNISDITAYYTCPLTPIALLVENAATMQAMDPRRVVQRAIALYRGQINRILADYEEVIRRLQSYNLIQMARRYLAEIRRVLKNFDEFVVDLGVRLGYCGYVKATCPALYASSYYPFSALVHEVSDWTFDGVLPSGIDKRAEAVMRTLSEAEVKLMAWRTIATIVV